MLQFAGGVVVAHGEVGGEGMEALEGCAVGVLDHVPFERSSCVGLPK